MSKKNSPPGQICKNRKASHDYHFEEKFEAGLALQGWEVKSLRAGKAQINEAHVIVRKAEVWLLNSHIAPLNSASTHIVAEASRTRKLLLNRKEINKLMGFVEQRGHTIVPLSLYWKANKVKVEIALAKGKKLFDKRADAKAKDWDRQKARLIKSKNL